MGALEKRNPAEGAAGEFSKLTYLPAPFSENLGDWQRLGDVAGVVVENLSARREAWLISRFRVSPAVARAVAVELFREVTA